MQAHYLPESYLRRFATDGWLHLYDREREKYRRQRPKEVATRRDYYAIPGEDGKKDYTIEDMFGRKREAELPVAVIHVLQEQERRALR